MGTELILAKQTFEVLWSIQNHKTFFFKEFCKKVNLSKNEIILLIAVERCTNNSNLTKLSKKLNMDEGNISRELLKLKNKKIIRIKKHSFDQRVQYIKLTTYGKQIMYDFYDSLLHRLSPFVKKNTIRKTIKSLQRLCDFNEHLENERKLYKKNKIRKATKNKLKSNLRKQKNR